MDWATFFGLSSLGVAGLAFASRDAALRLLALILFTAWLSTNLAVEGLGFTRAPAAISWMDGAFLAGTAAVGIFLRSRVAADVFILYGLVAAWHLLVYVLGIVGTYTHYAVANALFGAQLLIVGGHSGARAVYLWTLGRGERPGTLRSRRADLEEPQSPETAWGRVSDGVARLVFGVYFALWGCPAVLGTRSDGGAWILRRAVYRNCTASVANERCFSYTHGRMANSACSRYCPHLRARVGNPPPTGHHQPGSPAGAVNATPH